ncbi:hypothetical protein MKZ38_008901 [Zalerion maritima]|uniref:Uncharacterized protein n=1 Tax=Zalerion maritima TaxID=339359 RepID=A0AAD5RVE9_9PEZI|nr:hypothetical protein MKZ38_008901 [Zalerion maritima]
MAATMPFANPHTQPQTGRFGSWNFNNLDSNNDTPYQQQPSQFQSLPASEGMEVDVIDPAVVNSTGTGKKRKAETQDNERLCKRVSLLNLGYAVARAADTHYLLPRTFEEGWHANMAGIPLTEQNGERLYIPVEAPQSPSQAATSTSDNTASASASAAAAAATTIASPQLQQLSGNPTLPVLPGTSTLEENTMRLDDTPHKVYIYDLDAELASSDSDDSEHRHHHHSSRMAFLPDIEKHLRATRIPKAVLRPDDQGMYAGRDAKGMQLVLYDEPRSLSLPEGKDSVRRAILDARRRAREDADRVRERIRDAQRKVAERHGSGAGGGMVPEKDTLNGMGSNGMALNGGGWFDRAIAEHQHQHQHQHQQHQQQTMPKPGGFSSGFAPAGGFQGTVGQDDDAMDLDI